jgi:hypothetical protein
MANISKTEPAYDAASVSTNDTARIDPTRALFIGGAGNVKVDTVGGSTVTFNGLTAGSVLSVQVTRVYATGTTATDIIAMY